MRFVLLVLVYSPNTSPFFTTSPSFTKESVTDPDKTILSWSDEVILPVDKETKLISLEVIVYVFVVSWSELLLFINW